MAENPLVGRWELTSHVVVDGSGAEVARPLGPSPVGTLLYTADGFMSVHMTSGDRPSFGTRFAADGDPGQKAAAADTYIGYCGSYAWLGDRVVHRVEVSFFPDYVGTELVRAAQLSGDALTLRAYPPAVRHERPTPVLRWRRVRDQPVNSGDG
jgi:hypothetical protein